MMFQTRCAGCDAPGVAVKRLEPSDDEIVQSVAEGETIHPMTGERAVAADLAEKRR